MKRRFAGREMSGILALGPPLLGALVLTVMVLQIVKRVRGNVGSKDDDSIYEAEMPQDDAEDDEDKVKAFCFFGSQTGTAEGFAKDVASDLTKAGFKAEAFDLEEFDPDDFQDNVKYALFFMATYGEGDPCDNSIEFIAYLKKKPEDGGPEDGFASQVNFTVFGLGNTQYEHYNNIGKFTHQRMVELGGNELFPMGLGDDDGDMEEDFSNWSEGLVAAFAKHAFGDDAMANGSGMNGDADAHQDYKYKSIFVPAPTDATIVAGGGREPRKTLSETEVQKSIDLSSRHFFQGVQAKIVENRELRQDIGPGNTVHVEFALEGTNLTYNTADNLTVCPANDSELVELTGRCLGVSMDQWFVLEPAHRDDASHAKPLFPNPCTIRTALTYFTDLNGAPQRSLLGKLAHFVTMPEHKERLLFLASKEGKDEFHAYISDRMLSIAEVIETYPSFKLTEENLGPFFEVMPRLKGREFTISSSNLVQPDQVALTVGVVREEKPGPIKGRILNGVCSTYLRQLTVGQSALVFVKESTFKLPKDPKTPIIMIGPGTGVAPMRAFVQERIHQRDTLGLETGETILYFGCRREDEDFLYKDELLQALEKGALTKLHTAFSRQQKEKIYVQNVMAQHKAELWTLLEAGAYVFVCGATKMGKDVNHALLDVVKIGLNTDDEARAKQYLEAMQKDKRYIQELWSS